EAPGPLDPVLPHLPRRSGDRPDPVALRGPHPPAPLIPDSPEGVGGPWIATAPSSSTTASAASATGSSASSPSGTSATRSGSHHSRARSPPRSSFGTVRI